MPIDPKNISLDLKLGPFHFKITPDDSPVMDTKTKLELAKARRQELQQERDALAKLIQDLEGN